MKKIIAVIRNVLAVAILAPISAAFWFGYCACSATGSLLKADCHRAEIFILMATSCFLAFTCTCLMEITL